MREPSLLVRALWLMSGRAMSPLIYNLQSTRSNTAAKPWPPPMHIVSKP